ncbi:MAG TPA: polysaccharide export protein EpsE [Usitatibacter sp.]|jgi:polysaccharide export outer membrane protein|nr:polysaccharide export protein EpsE [Usitatibacter sp.]
MNISFRFPEIAMRLAAGAACIAAAAFAGLAQAHPPVRIATVTPSAPPRSAEIPTAAADAALESLGVGDQLRVTVFRNPELTTEGRITERGTILFPLIGEVQVAGMTPAQAGAAIAKKLRDGKFVVHPEVNVALAQVNSRQVAVLGAVNKPGRYPIDSQNSKLTDFLAAAGGIAPAGAEHVTLVSNVEGRTEKRDIDLNAIFRDGDLSKNVRLQPGDTIYVEKAPMVYIYGEVQKGGAYRLEPNMTVMQALALGGGLTARGTQRGIKIARHTPQGVRQIDARLTDPVKEDDVIYVSESLF